MFCLLRRFVHPVPDWLDRPWSFHSLGMGFVVRQTRRIDLHEPEHRVARDCSACVCGIARYLTHWETKVGQIQKIMGDVKPSFLQWLGIEHSYVHEGRLVGTLCRAEELIEN